MSNDLGSMPKLDEAVPYFIAHKALVPELLDLGAVVTCEADGDDRLQRPTQVGVVDGGMDGETMAAVVSLSGGALFANIVSVVLLVVETVSFQRR